jgi:uncharacterized protein YdhG (YjbR/CyaY superfamily)
VKSEAETVEQYMEEVPEGRKAALTTIRALIREAAPDATESMQYGMPTYELNGPLFAFASQKNYMSLYVQEPVLDDFRARLASLDLAKNCIRFRRIEKLPLDVIKELLEAAARRNAETGDQT